MELERILDAAAAQGARDASVILVRLPLEVRDAIDNVVATRNDYRTLQPSQVTDPNGNRSMLSLIHI